MQKEPRMTDAGMYLSEADWSVIAGAAKPLRPCDRSAFFCDVLEALHGQECGPGALHRAIRDCQRRYFDAPLETGDEHRH